jgi:hypothetical protein
VFHHVLGDEEIEMIARKRELFEVLTTPAPLLLAKRHIIEIEGVAVTWTLSRKILTNFGRRTLVN